MNTDIIDGICLGRGCVWAMLLAGCLGMHNGMN